MKSEIYDYDERLWQYRRIIAGFVSVSLLSAHSKLSPGSFLSINSPVLLTLSRRISSRSSISISLCYAP
ncbi:MAG: hypothetical protein QXL85_06955 [Candidatus Bathyarchaeia archaeon]